MKANIMDNGKAKRQFKELVRKEQVKNCEKCLAKLNRDFVDTSKYNALFHTMHLLIVLHDEYGFGKKRLERLLGAYADADKQFKEDLNDGVAWTKIVNRLQQIGLEFSDEDIQIGKMKERLYEKGITYYGKEKKRK